MDPAKQFEQEKKLDLAREVYEMAADCLEKSGRKVVANKLRSAAAKIG